VLATPELVDLEVLSVGAGRWQPER
jgi:hypothetical protein